MAVGRRRARREALFVLYQADLLELPVPAALERLEAETAPGHGPPDPYTRRLVEGVAARQEVIDDIIARNLTGWTIARLAPLERNVLRLGVFELAFAEDVPQAVAIDEAVGLAKTFCSDEAAGLVNGVLGAVQRERPRAEEYTSPPS